MIRRCPFQALFCQAKASSTTIFSIPASFVRGTSRSFASSVAGPSLIPGRQPPSPRIDSIKPHLQELAVRSASAREAIKEAVRAPSVEVGLRHFQDFLNMNDFSQTELARLAENHDIDRMRIMLELFKVWYMETKAPKIIQMNAPWEWFPKARMMKRRFIFHSGPTNSGKTHAALERLMSAKSGVYCAPLKALASQVWLRVNERVSCDLLIGDERQFAGNAEHVSCTVEMTPLELGVDVAVIDEIQLIEDRDRGWAWTRALLGLPAREIHLCGEPRALSIIKRLLWHTKEGGRLQIQEHRRLVPLDVEAQSLNGRLDNAAAGDCFVCFSRRGVFDTAKQLQERLADKNAQVHVVYGGLPFAVRQYESEAFNNGVEKGNFHVLVATDAIAYGLNLSIRRIIFSSMRKFDGQSMQQLSPSTILQVAGRAGRFGRRFSDHGYATTLHQRDFDLLESTVREGAQALQQVEQAGLLPTADVLAVFAETVPHLAFDEMVKKFNDSCTVNETFFVCDMARSVIAIAEEISDVVMPSVAEKILFCFAPMSSGGEGGSGEGMKFLKRLAMEHGVGGPVKLKIDLEVEHDLIVRADRVLGRKMELMSRHESVNQKTTQQDASSSSSSSTSSTSTSPTSSSDDNEEEALLFSVMHEEEKLLTSSQECSDVDFVSVLESFYKRYNPSKVAEVVALCQKYPDRKKILDGLKVKYSVASVVVDKDDLIRVIMKNRRSAGYLPEKSGALHRNVQLDSAQQRQELEQILRRCETLYRWVEVYGWLAWRFPKTFVDLELSARTKMDLVKIIDHLVKLQVHNG